MRKVWLAKVITRVIVGGLLVVVSFGADGLMDALGIAGYLSVGAMLLAAMGLTWAVDWVDVILDARYHGHKKRRH